MASSLESALTLGEEAADPSQMRIRVIAQARAFAPGSIVGDKYRVERELAEGGLGIVVIADHIELERKVAIKYLKPTLLDREVVVERFRQEAQLASSIRSDHVVRIFDVGSDPIAGPFMVMELLEGEDLASRLSRGALPADEAIDYVVQACDALAEAHALGIIHRDLKPENLFLAKRAGAPPIVKILDFGISKISERHSGSAGTLRARKMTEDGVRLGTPLYMSPEQLIGTPVDVPTDIWALGVVLYELLTGLPPFDGHTVAQLAANIVGSTPAALRTRLPNASEALESILSKCLEKAPEARFRNVAELVQELAAYGAPASQPRIVRIRHLITDGGASIRPPRRFHQPTPAEDLPAVVLPPARTKLALGGGVAAALIALLVGLRIHRFSRPTPTLPAVADHLVATPAPIIEPVIARIAEPAPPSVVASARPIPKLPLKLPHAAPSAPAPTENDYSSFGERH